MITRLAIAGYRSLRDVVLGLGQLTVITGANGSGKSSMYRSLRLLSEIAQGHLIPSLAAEGGLTSALWAGPERFSREMLRGERPMQGTVRSKPVGLRLGFAGQEFGYAVELGMPEPNHPFPRDPEIKAETMWSGEVIGRANIFSERRGPSVRMRDTDTGAWRVSHDDLSSFDSMVTHCADPVNGFELLMMRERMRKWRFYDNLRTDVDAPARRPQVLTYTPILAGDGADIAAAVRTIFAIGNDQAFAEAIEDAFPGSTVDVEGDDYGVVVTRQQGLLRHLSAKELSDGTLRYVHLVAALLSPRPPEIMILNEPEVSLHPSLLEPLARLLVQASARCQIVLVSHNEHLVRLLREQEVFDIELSKALGETKVEGQEQPGWTWPKR